MNTPKAEWVERCDAALRAEKGLTGGPLCIAHSIDDQSESFSYYVVVDADGARAATGSPDSPRATVTFSQSAEVAASIRSGELTAAEAVLLGKVTVTGNASALVEHRQLIRDLDTVVASVS